MFDNNLFEFAYPTSFNFVEFNNIGLSDEVFDSYYKRRINQ